MTIKSKVMAVLLLSFLFGVQLVKAQDDNVFNHLSAGVSTGTDGLVGLHVAMPIGHHVQARTGISFMPKFSYNNDYDVRSIANSYGYSDYYGEYGRYLGNVGVKGELNMCDFNLLFDIYPSCHSSFRFTAGAYIGKSKVVTLKNTTPISVSSADLEKIGVEIGDYLIPSSIDGYVDGSIKVNSFKPYLGVGFGRAVPKKRVSVMFDLGVQFWGKPGVYAKDFESGNDVKLSKMNFEGGDDDFNKILSKIVVYPVLSLKIFGRIL